MLNPRLIEPRQEELNKLYQEIREKRLKKIQKHITRSKNTPVNLNGLCPGDTPYGMAALQEECRHLALTPEGSRNTQMNAAAYKLGMLISGNAITQTTVELKLTEAARACGLPDAEIESTLRSGLEAGGIHPRGAPPLPDEQSVKSSTSSAPGQISEFQLTEMGNAERLVARCQGRIHWSEPEKRWWIYNGRYWETDFTGYIVQAAKRTIRALAEEAESLLDPKEQDQLRKHAHRSESYRAILAAIALARSEDGVAILPKMFDTKIHHLNFLNGTLDLRTLEFHSHKPEDLFTKCIPANYNPDALCPRFKKFLAQIFNGDEELIAFLQIALGMSLSGDVSEQVFFLLWGSGNNGKTTLMELIRCILDAYGFAANTETFLARRADRIPNDIAELRGARFVTADEANRQVHLDEATIKKLTGKQPLRARRLHENEFEFMPQFTLCLSVNHKPVIRDTSHGMWRRVYLIPFAITIPDDQVDTHLLEKLLEEREGILAWLAAGCHAWYQKGRLQPPACVLSATQEYRAEMDIIARFLEEECLLGSMYKVQSSHLNERYKQWCEQNGERQDMKQLGEVLKKKGLERVKGTHGVRMISGIGLRVSNHDQIGEAQENSATSATSHLMGGAGGTHVQSIHKNNTVRVGRDGKKYYACLVCGNHYPSERVYGNPEHGEVLCLGCQNQA